MDTKQAPRVSVILPIHEMENGAFFLWRLVNSLTVQTFKDWELIITKDGKMAENTNAGIKRARGELIKILYLDDYFSNPYSLASMVDAIGGLRWLICGTNNNQNPYYTNDIEHGNNKLGSPSALMIRNDEPLLFDENMSWLLDCDYYKRMFQKYLQPVILPGDWVTLGTGDHQMTNILTNEEKLKEHELIQQKYA